MTGVSGSGKSSLIFDILDAAAHARFNGASDPPGEHDSIEGFEYIDKVITIDQAHLGRIPRSNAATYSDAFTPIREAFAATPEARTHFAESCAAFVQAISRDIFVERRVKPRQSCRKVASDAWIRQLFSGSRGRSHGQ